MSQKKIDGLLYGAHMSIAGGIEHAIIEGQSINCTAIQFFTKSNRQWQAPALTQEEIALFHATAHNSSINSLVAHAGYLINIGSPNPYIEKQSITSLTEELHRCELLSIPHLVFHPGSALKKGKEECIKRIAYNMNTILSNATGETNLVLENMSGQGSTIGSSFEELAAIYNQIERQELVSICFDTCHAWASGYKFTTQEEYETLWENFDKIIGLNLLTIIHLNDSKNAFGSHIDRHEHIGKGYIGIEAFKHIMNDPRFFTVPKILETPKTTLYDDKENMTTLRLLINQETEKKLGLLINK